MSGTDGERFPTTPQFRLRWLARLSWSEPAWLTDATAVPSGESRVYARSKSGLYAVLDGIDATRGTVLLPEAIPSGVIGTVAACGFDAAYYPVDDRLTVDTAAFADRVADTDPEAVVLVHYLGFPLDGIDELVRIASEAGAGVVEDCARSVFSRDSDGRLLGSLGDAAVFSLHKVLPVPHGGLVVHRSGGLPSPTGQVPELRSIGVTAALSLHRLLAAVPPRFGGTLTGGLPSALGSLTADPQSRTASSSSGGVASRTGGSDDGSDPSRLDGCARIWPPRAPGLLSTSGLRHCDPATIRRTRQRNYVELRPRLAALNDVTVITPPYPDGVSPYGVGVLLPDRTASRSAFEALRGSGLPAEKFGWTGPADTTTDDRLLILPTHQQLPVRVFPRMADCIATSLD